VVLAALIAVPEAATLSSAIRFERRAFTLAPVQMNHQDTGRFPVPGSWFLELRTKNPEPRTKDQEPRTQNQGTGNYVVITGQDMDVTDEPGAPQLPLKPVQLVLPGRCRVKAVRVTPGSWSKLSENVRPMPAQRQQVLSLNRDGARAGCPCYNANAAFTEPDPQYYEVGKPYPSEPAVWTGAAYRAGSTVVDLLVAPVRYTGSTQQLELCADFSAEVAYEPLLDEVRPETSAFEYLIVTGNGLDTVFQRLADWKTLKGVPAQIRTMDWVNANYPGRDQAEQLRNYLKVAADSGVRYVLLGGDVGVVPFRKAFAMTSEAHLEPREDSLPCDLYFSDLDGTWDANQNDVFGEIADSVDLYPDVFVGRAPVNDVAQAQAFVGKVLRYEQSPGPDYEDKALFFAMVLWNNPYTDEGRHKDWLERDCFATGYDVTKLYQSLGNENRTAVMAAMREGQSVLNHDGHGWYDGMSCGPDALRPADADTITNSACGALYSIGCWTTAFDFASIGEAFVTNPHGGTIATIGNSSYGWGSPGNPGFGYSDKFDSRFWWMVSRVGLDHIGEALARAKEYYIPFSRNRNVYRWHQYEVNLMGDPELPLRTARPESLTVLAPAAIPVGQTSMLVSVSKAGQPVSGALVCLMKAGETYSKGYTEEAGQILLRVESGTPGDFSLTVTAANCYPVCLTIPGTSGAYVNFLSWDVGDSLGNCDGIANPGEDIFLTVRLQNAGNDTSNPVNLRLRTSDASIEMRDSTDAVGAILPGQSVMSGNAFEIVASADAADGHVARFELEISDGVQSRTFYPLLLIGRSGLQLERYYVTAPPVLPGETKGIRVALHNQGHGYAHATRARLVSLDPNIAVLLPDSIMLGEISQGQTLISADSFRVSVSNLCPEAYLAQMRLDMSCTDSSCSYPFQLLIGRYGFSDDLESGSAQWSQGGVGDLWHLSEYRSHSSSHAWYCGDEATHQYNDGMDAWISSAPFIVAENCSLKLWRWFQVPNYGVDGIYVILLRGGVAETLDFVGTGGALGEGGFTTKTPRHQDTKTPRNHLRSSAFISGSSRLGIEEDWAQECYDLSRLAAGETIQVMLAFCSDADGNVGEGFYIDDIEVTGGGPAPTFIAGETPCLRPARTFTVWPNPCKGELNLSLRGDLGKGAVIRVYDASGKLVRTISVSGAAESNTKAQRHEEESLAPWCPFAPCHSERSEESLRSLKGRLGGEFRVSWNGADAHGRLLAAGTYFIEARTATLRQRVKVLLTR
jgi:hypothetical protein